jgi:hypothetical protein
MTVGEPGGVHFIDIEVSDIAAFESLRPQTQTPALSGAFQPLSREYRQSNSNQKEILHSVLIPSLPE